MNSTLTICDAYAIWAKAVRDHLAEALQILDSDCAEAERLLRHAHNSVSAFPEIQAQFDPMNLGKRENVWQS